MKLSTRYLNWLRVVYQCFDNNLVYFQPVLVFWFSTPLICFIFRFGGDCRFHIGEWTDSLEKITSMREGEIEKGKDNKERSDITMDDTYFTSWPSWTISKGLQFWTNLPKQDRFPKNSQENPFQQSSFLNVRRVDISRREERSEYNYLVWDKRGKSMNRWEKSIRKGYLFKWDPFIEAPERSWDVIL